MLFYRTAAECVTNTGNREQSSWRYRARADTVRLSSVAWSAVSEVLAAWQGRCKTATAPYRDGSRVITRGKLVEKKKMKITTMLAYHQHRSTTVFVLLLLLSFFRFSFPIRGGILTDIMFVVGRGPSSS